MPVLWLNGKIVSLVNTDEIYSAQIDLATWTEQELELDLETKQNVFYQIKCWMWFKMNWYRFFH